MFVNELFESDTVMNTLVVYPGRFQPWHKGHKAVYDYLVKNYGRDNVFIATSNKVDPPRSPFTFSEKVQFMNLTGVSSDRIIETRDPYRSIELVQNYDPATTRLIFAVSEKDMSDDPRFSFKTKKDGSPSYLQPMPKDAGDMVPLQRHGYIMTVPTFNFTVLGQPMRSATEVRAQFAQADEETQRQIVTDLFGSYDNNVHDIMRIGLTMTEDANTLSVGTTLNLVKNYGNFNALTGVVKSVTPSGKLKIQITKAEPVPGKKGAVKVGDIVTMAQNYVKRSTVNELKFPGSDDGESHEDNYPCYDCGSTIMGHHTRLCELAEDWAIRDLPSRPGSQHWTGQIPKGLRPIPGLENKGPQNEAVDPKFVGFMNKALGDKVDPAKPAANMPADYSNFQVMNFDNMPGYRPAFKFGMSVLQAMDQQTRQHFINAPDDDLIVYMLNIADKKGFMPKYFVEEDLDEVTQWFDEIFADPSLESWTDLLKSMSGKPGLAEAFNQPEKLVWEKGDFGDVDAHTRLNDGTYLSIMFNKETIQDQEEAWNVSFWRGNSQNITGAGDAQRVFATVLNAIQTFIKKYQPNRLFFAIDKNADVGQNINSRTKLYDSLVLRYAKDWGFRFFRADTADTVIYQFSKIKQDALNELAPGGGSGGDDGDADPYRYPKPELYRRSIDFFGKFEADHFDREDMNDTTGEFKGYWGSKQIAYFKFDNPQKTGSDDPGMGWYYEPETDDNDDNTSADPAVDNSAQRKQQELGIIDAFLKSGQKPKPGSQIYSLMKRHGVAEGSFDNASPMTKDSVKQDRIRSLKNLIAIAKKKKLKEFAPDDGSGGGGDDDKYIPPDFGKPFKANYLGQNKFQVFCRRPQDPSNVITLNAEVQKYGLEWDDDFGFWFLDSPGAVYLSWKYGEIPLPRAIDQARNPGHIHDLVTDYLTNSPHASEIQKVAEYFGFTTDGEMNETVNEFAPPGSNDNEPDEYEILRQLAAQWWHGTEQEMSRAEKTLATMGWEIGQDESGDQDAGVFVVAAGDIHGDTYTAFGHAELEQVYRGLHEDAAGVGVIASKKQKNDPRYKTSLTVDVHPDTPKKNMRALRLI